MKPTAPARRPFWRHRAFWLAALGALAMLCLARALWNPGLQIGDGRDDRARNALWLGHGWAPMLGSMPITPKKHGFGRPKLSTDWRHCADKTASATCIRISRRPKTTAP